MGYMKESIDSGVDSVDSLDAGGAAESSATSTGYSEEAVREELQQLLSSRTFQGAEAHKRFLQYAVEHTLAGSSNEVKEFTLGVHVFHRGSSFDPRLDPIVRVEALRLRSRLAKYYETEGGDNAYASSCPPEDTFLRSGTVAFTPQARRAKLRRLREPRPN